MEISGVQITPQVSAYLEDNLAGITSFKLANQIIFETFGIKDFFENKNELTRLKKTVSENYNQLIEPERVEYGDFQTNTYLADSVTHYLEHKATFPDIVVEPTCGKGNFILSCLKNFNSITHIYGLEIYKPYVWQTKFSIISFFLKNPQNNKPEISVIHCDVFDFDFSMIAKKHATNNVLIIGNPPWVTNAKLGSLNSSNLPQKTNFKNHSGLDAITGKGNFDIAEYIMLLMLKSFHQLNGYMLFLVKNSVIKNIVFDQGTNKYPIALIEKHCINSKKEFNAAVEASLFFCKLNSVASHDCIETDFYTNTYIQKFGWVQDKFVSNIDTYIETREIDGKSPFEWRQGLKHDCAAIMELDKMNGHYTNGKNEIVELEDDLVYGFLKSSDLKNTVITHTRKHTIVTQKKVGQNTTGIQLMQPKTYKYLVDHKAFFDARKSIIYNNKPLFSIFGIGDYSFKPYKVAISGLYKTFHFTLVLPQAGKPIMLDDTCYFIGFDRIEYAIYSLMLLNSAINMHFLQSITFSDAKRTFTKDILMRIDLLALSQNINMAALQQDLNNLNIKYKLALTLNLWEEFIDDMSLAHRKQIILSA